MPRLSNRTATKLPLIIGRWALGVFFWSRSAAHEQSPRPTVSTGREAFCPLPPTFSPGKIAVAFAVAAAAYRPRPTAYFRFSRGPCLPNATTPLRYIEPRDAPARSPAIPPSVVSRRMARLALRRPLRRPLPRACSKTRGAPLGGPKGLGYKSVAPYGAGRVVTEAIAARPLKITYWTAQKTTKWRCSTNGCWLLANGSPPPTTKPTADVSTGRGPLSLLLSLLPTAYFRLRRRPCLPNATTPLRYIEPRDAPARSPAIPPSVVSRRVARLALRRPLRRPLPRACSKTRGALGYKSVAPYGAGRVVTEAIAARPLKITYWRAQRTTKWRCSTNGCWLVANASPPAYAFLPRRRSRANAPRTSREIEAGSGTSLVAVLVVVFQPEGFQ